MDRNANDQARRDAAAGRDAANMQSAHWRTQQDYNAAYAREKEKQNR